MPTLRKRIAIVLDEEQRDRFWSKVCLTPTTTHEDCWEWIGGRNQFGYGQFKVKQRPLKAHRVAWVLHSGMQIPDDKEIDHLCRNKSCVNPRHLELVTTQENTLRSEGITARLARKTHCALGHPLEQMRFQRRCRICTARQTKESRERLRAR